MNQENKNREETDLSKMLENSDSGVKFQDEWQRPNQSFHPKTSKIIQWVIRYSGGLVKDEKQANYVLIGFVIIATTIALLLFFGESNNTAREMPVDQFVPY